MYLAIRRRCDAEDPFWSDCIILGLFSSKEEAENACVKNKKKMMDEDPHWYHEIEADNNELFAIGNPEVGCPAKDSWRIEKIELNAEQEKNEMSFINDDLRKDIEKVLNNSKKLYRTSPNGKHREKDISLINDLENLFEKWYDMRVSACLV